VATARELDLRNVIVGFPLQEVLVELSASVMPARLL
jgi:hypothetical protein